MSASSASRVTIPTWALVWFVISSSLVVWDGCYVLLRPRSMPGGDLAHFWSPYALYVQYDPFYGDLANAFIIAQSWVNFLEVAMSTFAIVGSLCTRSSWPAFVAMLSAMATLSKTVLYFVHDQVNPVPHAVHLDPTLSLLGLDNAWSHRLLFVLVVLIPNGLWVLFPFQIVRTIGAQFVRIVDEKVKSKAQ